MEASGPVDGALRGDADVGEQPAERRDPLLLAAASAVVSGLGQWLAGRRRRAVFLFVPFATASVLAVVAVSRGFWYLLDLLVRPGFLWWLFGANLALLALRLFSVVDAYRLGRWKAASIPMRMAAIAVVLVVVAPHVVVANYSVDGIGIQRDVFGGPDDPAAREAALRAQGFTDADFGPVLSTLPLVATTTTAVPATTRALPSATSTTAAATTVPLPTVPPPRDSGETGDRDPSFLGDALPIGPETADGRISVLLAGGDAGPGRSGLRTDVMMVAVLDLDKGGAAIFGLPRNLSYVPLPPEFSDAFVDLEMLWQQREAAATATTAAPTTTAVPGSTTTVTAPTTTSTTSTQPPFVSCGCYVDMLNSLYPRTRSWIRTFPDAVDPGMEALRRTVSYLIGIDIDYYVLVDMAGFVSLVDAIGGVDVYFDKPMHIAFSPAVEGGEKALIDVGVGMNHLDGLETLAYVRNRYGSSDYVRMERQRCLLRSVADSADLFTLIRSFSTISDALRDSTRTNLPLDLLPELMRYVARLDAGEIATLAFGPGYYAPERDFLRRPIPDPARIREGVRKTLAGLGQAGTGSGSGQSECDPS